MSVYPQGHGGNLENDLGSLLIGLVSHEMMIVETGALSLERMCVMKAQKYSYPGHYHKEIIDKAIS